MSAVQHPITQDDITHFLNQQGWGEATYQPLGADMGLRRYARLKRGNQTALFMDMSRAGILETGLDAFVTLAQHFSKNGVNAPKIIAYDLDTGLSIIEDFGSISFGQARKQGESDSLIYQKATDVLMAIRDSAKANTLELNGYQDTLIRKRLHQFVDYYMPLGAGRLTTQADQDEFQAVLKQIEKTLPPCPMAICHADFHLENLMWCPDKPDGYGLIDFQDAFWGPMPYDLLNLLEDARQTVPADIKQAMKDRYCNGMNSEDRAVFDDWYTYMSMHFHCRVIGLFIKFARENGGTQFLDHIPRLQEYIRNNLQNPHLKPLQEFMSRHKVSFEIILS
ncbi:MAG: phosphotransferase [Alphaproteobacteria bacterium]|nr:phosphotransferase [Alphaproteobacteria bacterium]NCQ87703.1 phosphotransferase [Alphaproteobacteria bacterium]NCT05788.1 phosphotransferase [Alphaproteobacteria bacterium]